MVEYFEKNEKCTVFVTSFKISKEIMYIQIKTSDKTFGGGGGL